MDMLVKLLKKPKGSFYVTIPKEFCDRYSLTGDGDEYFNLIIHQIAKKDKLTLEVKTIEVCKVQYESS